MNIAELFISLGIKGDDKTEKSLKNTETGLGKVKSMSLEAKAALVGVVYGLERMMSQSAQMGTSLLNFTTLTGISAQELQKWQYAARQVGVSSEEMTGSLKAVQNAMTNMLLGKGAPEGMAMLANKVGFDPEKARDTLYVMGQLQKFAQEVPNDVGNQMLKSFGLSEGTISAMRRNAFRPEVLQRAPTYSDREINSLNKADVAWANLGNKIQMAFGHFNAKHGAQLVGELSKVTTEIIKMVNAFTVLAEKLKLIQGIGKVFEGWSQIFQGITAVAEGKVGLGDLAEGAKDLFKGIAITANENAQNLRKDYEASQAAPNLRAQPTEKNQNINVTQTLQFQHDGKDAKKTAGSVHKAVKDAYRQMSTQSQGN